MRAKTECCFDVFDGLTYRICYGLTTEGKMDYSVPHYEFHKNCNCKKCSMRSLHERVPVNSLTVTTDDKSRFPEIKKIIDEYTCKVDNYIGTMYISLISGKREAKIVRIANGKVEETTLQE